MSCVAILRTKAFRSLLVDTSAKLFIVFIVLSFLGGLFLGLFFRLFVYLGAGGSDVDEAFGGAEIGPEDGVVHVPASCLVSAATCFSSTCFSSATR